MKDKIAGIIVVSLGYMTIIILAAVYMHSIKIEEKRWCISETGHKRVLCPEDL